jgi:hypothetical protein
VSGTTDADEDLLKGSFVDRYETATAITAAFDDVFDQSVEFHGYADHMRDYDVVVHATADPRTGIAPQHLLYRFRHCVQVGVESVVGWDVWRRSLDDRLTDYGTGVDLDGYVWGVKWQNIYPGMELVADSVSATAWSDRLGIPMHEAHIVLNAHEISLVFSGLEVRELPLGWTPYTARTNTID